MLQSTNSQVALGSSNSSKKGKEKCKESNSPGKNSSSNRTKRLHRSEGQGGSGTLIVPIKESQGVPLVCAEEFVFSKANIRGSVNNLVYNPRDKSFLRGQSIRDLTHFTPRQALQIASAARHIEEDFLPTFEMLQGERQTACKENKAFSEQVQALNGKLAKTTGDLEATFKALKNEKHFKALTDKQKYALQKSNNVLKEKIKNVEDSYLEAKLEIDKDKSDLEKALKELEETKLKLKEAKSGLDAWNEKYENVVTRLGPEAYYNTVEHLMVLNPDLIVTGSDPYSYVIDGIIMEDSPNGLIPFVHRKEGVGDSDPNPNQGVLK
ncbi:AH/BAR domain superfamily [Sesbania bispinosa]|nr:AH/BAR domain superfamily [Sesbania bispinosa]